MAAPDTTVATPSSLVMARSATTGAAVTVSLSEASLLLPSGSLAPAGAAIVAVLATLPGAAVTVAVTARA